MLAITCKSSRTHFIATAFPLHLGGGQPLHVSQVLSFMLFNGSEGHDPGMSRPSMRGVPPAIKQEEVTKKQDLVSVRNTVKVAILKGDKVCKELCFSFHVLFSIFLLAQDSLLNAIYCAVCSIN